MDKRVSARAVIIQDDSVYAMFRRVIKDDGSVKEYYVVPGGGQEGGESLRETVTREIKEEFTVDIKIKGYLGYDEDKDSIAHFYDCEIINGKPQLGGEELERNCASNFYEIRKVSINELDKVDILSTDMIMNAYNEKYVDEK